MKKLNRRILSALLAFLLFLSNFPAVSAAKDDFAITYEGKTVKQVEFYEYEKITVSVEGIPEGSSCQWQIQIPGTEQWVDIHGQTAEELGLSKAVVGSLMVDGSAYVRCAATGDAETNYTDALQVTVKETEFTQQENVIAAPVEIVPEHTEAHVEKATEATEAPTEAPVEETTEATEAPTEAPVEETTEATEAPTEVPVEETTEATEAPTEVPVEETTEATEIPTEAPAESSAEPAEIPAAPAVIPSAPVEISTEPEEISVETEQTPTGPVEISEQTLVNNVMNALAPRAAADEGETSENPPVLDDNEIVTITINYVYWDRQTNQPGSTTWDPYIASVQKGTSFVTERPIANKIVPGYKTTWGKNGDTDALPPVGATLVNQFGAAYNPETDVSSYVDINLQNVTSDVEYTVYYEEVMVPYHARYFLQNIYNDLYTEDNSYYLAFQGYQNTEPNTNDIYIDIYGFTPLFHQPDTIAADGSTVFEVYCDRNYYLINFNMDGGFGTAPVYARYGTAFSVSLPTKPGHSFDGWQEDLNKRDINTNGSDQRDETYIAARDNCIAGIPLTQYGRVTKIPFTNMTYTAKWAAGQTTFTVAYWIQGDTVNDRTYIGSEIQRGTPGTEITKNHINPLESAAICNEEAHTHGDSCRCSHVHTPDSGCYNGYSTGSLNGDETSAFNKLGEYIGNHAEPQSGYAYKLEKAGDANYPKYFAPYRSDTHATPVYYIVNESNLRGEVAKTTDGSYTITKYYAKLACDHTHSSACTGYNCGIEEHTHNSDCYRDIKHLNYLGCDLDSEKVYIANDGSTVVNVIYQYEQYTLRFYYAATTGGTATDNDRNASTYDTVQVVGGSTYHFGGQHGTGKSYSSFETNDYSAVNMLVHMFKQTSQIGTVNSTKLPSMKDDVPADLYTLGQEKGTDGRTYHYISFQARYGDDIAQKWPVDVFDKIEMQSGSYNANFGKYAMVSAWNGEHHIWYSKNQGNETIKGRYEKLDDKLLYDSSFADSKVLSFLCFWQNGANVGWSIPELYIYNIWLPYRGTDAEFEALDKDEKKTHKGVNYYLHDSYYVCDDSRISNQTVPSLTGYTYTETEWGVIFINKAYSAGNHTYIGQGSDDSKIKYNDSTLVLTDSQNWESDPKKLTVAQQDDGTYLLYCSDYYTKYRSDDLNETLYREAYYRDYYYDANGPYNLKFRNLNKYMMDGTGETFDYGADLSKFKLSDTNEFMINGYKDPVTGELIYGPFYPDSLEPNAYYFDGWYTTSKFIDGTRVNWETMTMPDSNLEVYAKWEPVTYKTYFYLDYEHYRDRWTAEDQLDPTKVYRSVSETKHGEKMDLTDILNDILYPKNGDYRFNGWFYYDTDGTKKAFNPSEMAVRKELHLFAEWTSSITKEYTVHYYMGDKDGNIIYADENGKTTDENGNPLTALNGNPIKLADVTTGRAFESTTKTFKAKPKDQLNLLSTAPDADPNKLWLPNTNSHSIVMNADNSQNEYAFVYMAKENAPYVVRYVDSATGREVHEQKDVEQNDKGFVTEKFVYVPGYIPESFYKTLVLSANNEENVIVFFYSKDEDANEDENGELEGVNSLYYVVHYAQDADDPDVYHEVNTETIKAKIGTTVKAVPFSNLTSAGYEVDYNNAGTVSQGEVTTDGLELKLYYIRTKYGYEVIYKEYGTDNEIAPRKVVGKTDATANEKVPFGKIIEEEAIAIRGYDLYSSKTQSLKISTDETKNVITFEYVPKPLTINYIPSCTDTDLFGFGKVTKSREENTQIGSQAIPSSGFKFVGWYKSDTFTAENHISVDQYLNVSAYVDPSNPPASYEYNFYALFAPITLTISQSNMAATDSAIYEVVQGTNTVARVMLTGTDSVTLYAIPAGNYTIQEISGNWTWTYTDTAPQDVIVVAGQNNQVSFSYTAKNIPWLHSETHN